MEVRSRPAGTPSPQSVLSVLADGRRRRLVGILLEQAAPVTEERLATLLATGETGRPPVDVSVGAVESRLLDLQHVHLPILAAADLVVRDRRRGTVAPTDHPALADPKITRILETDAAEWDAILTCLADERRRTVLAVLLGGSASMSVVDLVQAVAVREAARGGDDRSLQSLRTSLHHVHLPELDDAGLIDYDAVAGTVAYGGHPALDRRWLDVAPGEAPRPILPDAGRSADHWQLEGRGQVTQCARTLFASADEELYVMVTRSGLVDDVSLRRLRDAVARGVDLYVGSQAAEVRDRIRREVPEATLWEPPIDWLDPPAGTDSVARIVVADRSVVLLGTHAGGSGDVATAEAAITATGEDTALVLLLGGMLGSRLDNVDEGSGDSTSEIRSE